MTSTKATQGSHNENKRTQDNERARPKDNDKSRVQCYKCKGYGHYATDAECPLHVKPAFRRFAEAPIIEEDEEHLDEESEKLEQNERSEEKDLAGERDEDYEPLEGSQYDSDESVYIAAEEYEAYTSEDEEPLQF